MENKQKELLIHNLKIALKLKKNLESSIKSLDKLMPLKNEKDQLDLLSDEIKEKLDAFRIRFSDLQDFLGSKVFRSLLVYEQEKIGSQLDIFHQVEKRGLIHSTDAWTEIRRIRNASTHDYPEHEKDRLEALNNMFLNALMLIDSLTKTEEYVKKIFESNQNAN